MLLASLDAFVYLRSLAEFENRSVRVFCGCRPALELALAASDFLRTPYCQ
jgi:hypothetical protein